MKTRTSYTSDYVIATVVIICTVALLVGLVAILTGFHWRAAGRILHVDFPDVAGIHQHSPVRYAGAPAGAVVGMRHLTREERLASANPRNAVRVTVRLREDLPPIPDDVLAVLGADTLLSEKFIGLSAGSADGPQLADGAVIQGLPQPTFDDLVRNLGDLAQVTTELVPKVKQQLAELLPKLATMAEMGGSVAKEIPPLLAKVGTLMDDLTALAGSGKDIATDTQALLGQANTLMARHESDIAKTLEELPQVLGHLDALLGRTQGLLASNDKDLQATLRDLRLVMQDMRVVLIHAKSFTAALAGGRPTRLIWTKDDESPPPDAEVLRKATSTGKAGSPSSAASPSRKMSGRP